MIRLSRFVGLVLALALPRITVDGVQLANKPPILACHVPLELKIFCEPN